MKGPRMAIGDEFSLCSSDNGINPISCNIRTAIYASETIVWPGKYGKCYKENLTYKDETVNISCYSLF